MQEGLSGCQLGLRLNEVFGANGKPWDATDAEPETYVEARG